MEIWLRVTENQPLHFCSTKCHRASDKKEGEKDSMLLLLCSFSAEAGRARHHLLEQKILLNTQELCVDDGDRIRQSHTHARAHVRVLAFGALFLGSPLSPVVASIVMQGFEKMAIGMLPCQRHLYYRMMALKMTQLELKHTSQYFEVVMRMMQRILSQYNLIKLTSDKEDIIKYDYEMIRRFPPKLDNEQRRILFNFTDDCLHGIDHIVTVMHCDYDAETNSYPELFLHFFVTSLCYLHVIEEKKSKRHGLRGSYSREKPERGHAGPKPVTAKCCRTLLFPDKVDVNYIALRVHFSEDLAGAHDNSVPLSHRARKLPIAARNRESPQIFQFCEHLIGDYKGKPLFFREDKSLMLVTEFYVIWTKICGYTGKQQLSCHATRKRLSSYPCAIVLQPARPVLGGRRELDLTLSHYVLAVSLTLGAPKATNSNTAILLAPVSLFKREALS
ncbi:hypothetical protein G5I_03704 [Acromyrmex echinatior]|uniref:Uncharacterized protein n=1 Tax=Acromyrmex echinatior TaxID=103372 RepID=F4WDP7_ACREC|nr:hypothetical protein G5I_03704 [Acromyrmex echinatior]